MARFPNRPPLIGQSDDVAAKLMQGTPTTVKQGVDETTAQRYVETLKKIGVACHLEAQVLERDLPPAQVATTDTAPPVRKRVQGRSRRNLTYALIATLVAAAHLFPGMFTQLFLGAVKSEDLPTLLTMAPVVCAIVFATAYVICAKTPKARSADDTAYKPSRRLVVAGALLVVVAGHL